MTCQSDVELFLPVQILYISVVAIIDYRLFGRSQVAFEYFVPISLLEAALWLDIFRREKTQRSCGAVSICTRSIEGACGKLEIPIDFLDV